MQQAYYAVNTPTKAKLFERQLMLTQDYKLFELLIFLVYVLCILRLSKLKTEGQQMYICYLPAGWSVLGKTVPEVLSK